ncbi:MULTISPECIES: FxsA family protein [Bacillus]|uniref:FxsA family protein n=1 Tax=Bacillus TaxID=1386 RepID=UPI000BB7FACE|nr:MULTISPECIES: FxsA family protein [Bacillus]
MFKLLLALIIIVPALEIWLLIFSGKTLGVLVTILLIIFTGVLGAWLAKYQGIEALRKAQQQMSYGQMPGDVIIDGLCILVGGVVLLTPGFLTDALGFMLLIPTTRNFIKPLIYNTLRKLVDRGQFIIINKR